MFQTVIVPPIWQQEIMLLQLQTTLVVVVSLKQYYFTYCTTIQTVSQQNVKCFGNNTGSINIAASGGTGTLHILVEW